MSDARPILKLVQGVQTPRTRTLWKCAVCTAADIPSGPLIEVILEADVCAGKVEPGDKGLACLSCHQRGILTLI